VESARPVSAKEVQSYEAGIFLGKDAVKAGLADAVCSWDDLLEEIGFDDLGQSVPK
jgi:ClpP class serine protease